ncbi:hypothetical protein PHLGIDRAFT_11426 [Phlebiopsis gigantea 11061_1 CR5-6]|uniref:BTB domain-containing protein n=1 Tax=Phlebiopsis gigantea (strain 11061_1 CR5-6) TaxID=745531 RepID=A0A0C3NXN7_PHLG1|nr:hypothetical protein PHLGIDRAFT_11426 [Phlebiopsis gigantea 11061_1 CR5-6]
MTGRLSPATSLRPALVTGENKAFVMVGYRPFFVDTVASASPPRKRLRLDMENTIGEEHALTLANDGYDELKKHSRFYHADGDCAIRVQDTLFRVHRFLLSRDSSAFEDMFSMPRCGNSPKEGHSDEEPILLESENVDDFAELLSILYALPSELQDLRSNPANVYRLLAIAEITNKYHFVSTSSWAISALCQVTECRDEPWRALRTTQQPRLPPPAWCTAPILRRIIEVAQLCGHQMLCDHAAEKWIELIYIGRANPVYAMAVADEYGLPRLKGISYYEALLSCDDSFECMFEPVSEGSERPAMAPAQKAGLLSGFFSLVRRWESLRATAPTFAKPDGCTYHAHGCLSTWQAVWKSTTKCDAMVHRRTADVLGHLGAMAYLLEADRDLRKAAVDSVRELWKREEEELAYHFRDLTRPGPN